MPTDPWMLFVNTLFVSGVLLWVTLLLDSGPVVARIREGFGWLEWRPFPPELPRRATWALTLGFVLQILILRENSPLLDAPLSIKLLATMLLFQGLAVAVIFAQLRFRRVPVSLALGLDPLPRVSDAVWGLGGYCLALPLVALVGVFTQMVFEYLGIPPEPQSVINQLREVHALSEWIFVFALVGGLAPLLEEILFRGLLFTWLGQNIGVGKALLVQAFIFAMIHQNAASFAGLFVLALVLGLIYLHTRRLWVCVALHAVFNCMSLLNLLLIPSKVLP